MQRFLSELAVRGRVAASTQNQALNALVFLYGQVLHQELGRIGEIEKAKRPERLPVMLTHGEVERVLLGIRSIIVKWLSYSGDYCRDSAVSRLLRRWCQLRHFH